MINNELETEVNIFLTLCKKDQRIHQYLGQANNKNKK